MSSWQVYIARCADGTLYTGIARDVEKRIAEHNADKGAGANYTRARRPVVLVYQEAAADRSTASKREYQIKQLSRTEKLALVMGNTEQVTDGVRILAAGGLPRRKSSP